MSQTQKLQEEIRHLHDEAALKLHLASMDLKQEWKALDLRWQDFQEKAKLADSAQDISEAVAKLGRELRAAFQRFSKAL